MIIIIENISILPVSHFFSILRNLPLLLFARRGTLLLSLLLVELLSPENYFSILIIFPDLNYGNILSLAKFSNILRYIIHLYVLFSNYSLCMYFMPSGISNLVPVIDLE